MLVRVALEEVPRLEVDGNPLPDLGQVGVVELGLTTCWDCSVIESES